MENEDKLNNNENEFVNPLTNRQKDIQILPEDNLNKKFPNLLTNLNPIENFFYIEILKEGKIIEKKFLNKSKIVLGRAVDCDIIFEHPSISRYHCALYWKENCVNKVKDLNGFFYLTDLNSSHGTFLNKKQIESQKLIKLNPNQSQIKLGISSRLLLYNIEAKNDEENEEDLSNFSSQTFKLNTENDTGCMWGIKYDDYYIDNSNNNNESNVETILKLLKEQSINSTENENAYLGNPQKTIQQWFYNEGFDFEYKIEFENEKFKVTINLPIDGQEIPIIGNENIKKKDSIHSCCLKLCKILDKANILYEWQRNSKQVKRKSTEYSNSDEDDLIDETGEIETKKLHLKNLKNQSVDNIETLNKKLIIVNEEINQLNKEFLVLNELIKKSKESLSNDIEEDMDVYFEKMSKSNLSLSDCKIKKSKVRMKLNQLNKDKVKLEKYIKLVNPISINKKNELNKNKNANVLELIRKAQTKLKESSVKREESTSINNTLSKNVNDNLDINLGNNLNKNINSLTVIKPSFKVNTNLKDKKLKINDNFFDTQNEELNKKKINLKKTIISSNDSNDDKIKEKIKSQSEFDSSYIEWLPPVDQTGNGRCDLNEKYGY